MKVVLRRRSRFGSCFSLWNGPTNTPSGSSIAARPSTAAPSSPPGIASFSSSPIPSTKIPAADQASRSSALFLRLQKRTANAVVDLKPLFAPPMPAIGVLDQWTYFQAEGDKAEAKAWARSASSYLDFFTLFAFAVQRHFYLTLQYTNSRARLADNGPSSLSYFQQRAPSYFLDSFAAGPPSPRLLHHHSHGRRGCGPQDRPLP